MGARGVLFEESDTVQEDLEAFKTGGAFMGSGISYLRLPDLIRRALYLPAGQFSSSRF